MRKRYNKILTFYNTFWVKYIKIRVFGHTLVKQALIILQNSKEVMKANTCWFTHENTKYQFQKKSPMDPFNGQALSTPTCMQSPFIEESSIY